MKKIFVNNHAEAVTPARKGEEVWYLPIFGVYHAKKQSKIRVVFDSAAKYNGLCLNDILMKGPDLTNNLVGVLLKFRKGKVAAIADVEQMFFNFEVNEEHRNYLRFVWFKDNTVTEPLTEYRMKVHVFGNSPSPAVANYGLRKAVCDHTDLDTCDDVCHYVNNNFYVDDGLVSGDSPEEIVSLIKRTQERLITGGKIRLHKIVSNNSEVVKSFETKDLAESITEIDFNSESTCLQRSLGLCWNVVKDIFTYQLSKEEKPFTKRGLLSVINGIFDPLGFIAPVILGGRLIMREAVQNNSLDWDDPLPDDLLSDWQRWKQSLQDLETLEIGRPFTSQSLNDSTELTLSLAKIVGETYTPISRSDSDSSFAEKYLMVQTPETPEIDPIQPYFTKTVLTPADIDEQLVSARQNIKFNSENLKKVTFSTSTPSIINSSSKYRSIAVMEKLGTCRKFAGYPKDNGTKFLRDFESFSSECYHNQFAQQETRISWGHQARPLRKVNGAEYREPAPFRHSGIVNTLTNTNNVPSFSGYSDNDTSEFYSDNENFSIARTDSKFIYLHVKFHSVQVAALLDSGSSINIMSTSLYNSIPQACKSMIDVNNGDNIKLANDQNVQVKGTATVKMYYKGDKHCLQVYILEQMSHPFILGTSYLKDNKITIDFGESEVVQKHANIRCRKRITLDPHSEIIIWGRLPRNIHFGYQGMCESSTQILSHGLISSKAVVTVSQDRTVPVKILNPGSNSVVIPKGKIIAKFSQLTEEYQVRHVNCKNDVPVVQNINLVKQCPAEQVDSINCEFLENFEINPNLKDDQKIALNHLLCDNKEVFVTTDSPNLGCTDIAQHHIILKPDNRPLHQKPYRLTPHKKEVLRHHLDELLQQGVICELNATEEDTIFQKEGIRPPPDRVRALNEFPPPQNVKQLRRALGMFNWFRKFIPNYNSAAEPLTRLLKKSAKFVWSQEQETSFTRIKHLLLTSAVLAFPRFDLQPWTKLCVAAG
ncbi:unnamed protein product [Mytilus edulis]|uniref:Peptidase A2 domain-containing protein n=1 Tax=Mytilus edulis TaxID=6550 RepID=A0A8S3S6C9_MYTED|nr:unnamed protein product [Mytilus edulis]